MYDYTCIYTQLTHIHACIHTHACAHTHTYAHTHTRTHAHTHLLRNTEVAYLSSPLRTTARASNKWAASRAYGRPLHHSYIITYYCTYFSSCSWSTTKYHQQVDDWTCKHHWSLLSTANTCALLWGCDPQASNQNGQKTFACEQVSIVAATSEAIHQADKTSNCSLNQLYNNIR